MEPILPTPVNLEGQAASRNVQPVSPSQTVESTPNTTGERSQELAGTPPAIAPPPASPSQQVVPSAPPAVSAPVAQVVASDSPQIADDVDVIEKEWVDKAKKIVSATKSDPHQQEKEVNKLQADYLMKRYNKQLKMSE
mgnify:CR=1 FL=1